MTLSSHFFKSSVGKSAGIDDDFIMIICQDVRDGFLAVIISKNIRKTGYINITHKKADLLVNIIHIQFVHGSGHGNGKRGVRKIMEIHFSMKIPGRLIKEGSFAEVLFLGGKIYCVIDIEVGIAIFQIKVQRIFIEADTIPDFVRYTEEFAVG